MPEKGLSIRADNKGLAVRLNLWSLETYLEDFTPMKARLWIRGQATNAETKEAVIFNDPGQLISILGKWNVAKFKQLKTEAKATKRN